MAFETPFGVLFASPGLPKLPGKQPATYLRISTDFGKTELSPIISMPVAGPLSGIFADARNDRRVVMLVLYWIMVAGFGALCVVGSPLLIFIVAVPAYVAYGAATPLLGSVCVRLAERYGFDYGRVRIWASSTFVTMNVTAGIAVKFLGLGAVAPLLALGAALCVISTLTLPSPPAAEGRAPLDWVGMHYYLRLMASDSGVTDTASLDPLQGIKIELPSVGSKSPGGWEMWPNAFYDMLMAISRDYGNPIIEITETGTHFPATLPLAEQLHDGARITWYKQHLAAMARAIKDGANVRAYHAWSLLDNLEWRAGFTRRYGLVAVDFATQARTIKDSGLWYGRVAAANRLVD